jgi:hypothetical protein
MVGYVDERAADGGGQLFAAYCARCVEVGCREDADAIGRVGEGDFDCGKEFGEGFVAGLFILLGFERDHLLVGELVALGVAEDAVYAAGDVAEMECDGRQAERRCVDLGVGKAGGPFGDVVESQFESVEDGAAYGWNVGVRAAEPGFRIRSDKRSGAAR